MWKHKYDVNDSTWYYQDMRTGCSGVDGLSVAELAVKDDGLVLEVAWVVYQVNLAV